MSHSLVLFKKDSEKVILLEQKYFAKIVIISLTFTFITLPAFGQGIELTNIRTDPQEIHIGDSFRINATIVNSSPNTIFFNGGCQSPISATFDKNVVTDQAMGCLAIINVQVKPGQNITISGPSATNLYNASSPGVTNANVTFSYMSGNNTNTISKIFHMNILERTSMPEFPSIGALIFAISSMFAIFVIVLKKNHDLFKL